jgi:hypothetical protein
LRKLMCLCLPFLLKKRLEGDRVGAMLLSSGWWLGHPSHCQFDKSYRCRVRERGYGKVRQSRWLRTADGFAV